MKELHSETIFTVGSVDFSFRLLKTDDGPKLVISQEARGLTGNQMSFNISKESLRILAIQFWKASQEDYEDSVDTAVFDEEKSTLTLEMKDEMIDEGLKSNQFGEFIHENVSERVEDSIPDGAKDLVDDLGKGVSKMEERVNEIANSEEVKDVAEGIQSLFQEGRNNRENN